MGQAFQPEQLALIDQAFEQAWAELSSNPNRTSLEPDILKMLLRKKLLVLVGAGMVDPELMRKIALGTLLKYEREMRPGV